MGRGLSFFYITGLVEVVTKDRPEQRQPPDTMAPGEFGDLVVRQGKFMILDERSPRRHRVEQRIGPS
jgi:hypothetical protein